MGLIEEGVFLEDLKILVPYRVAVQIPAHQTKSPQLRDALTRRRLFRLQGSLPAGATFRGSGAVPRAAAPVPRPPPPPARTSEIELLRQENAQLRKKLAEAEAKVADPPGLAAVLTGMSEQISALQAKIDQGLVAPGASVPAVRSSASEVEDDIPMFIPELDRSGAVAHIEVRGKASESDLGGARDALRNLRRKKSDSGS